MRLKTPLFPLRMARMPTIILPSRGFGCCTPKTTSSPRHHLGDPPPSQARPPPVIRPCPPAMHTCCFHVLFPCIFRRSWCCICSLSRFWLQHFCCCCHLPSPFQTCPRRALDRLHHHGLALLFRSVHESLTSPSTCRK